MFFICRDKLHLQCCCLLCMLILTVFQYRPSDLCSQKAERVVTLIFLKYICFKRQDIKIIVKCLHKKTQSNYKKSVFYLHMPYLLKK